MASTINAKTTGVGGIDASGDASGVLALQTGGTTALTIDASQNVKLSAAGTAIQNSSGRPILNQTGSVLQVVNALYGTQVTSSTSTIIDTGLTATITPSSTSSKILVMVSQAGVFKGNSANLGANFYINRAGVNLSMFGYVVGYTSVVTYVGTTISGVYLDSPATTSATVYKTTFSSSGVATDVQRDTAGISSIVLMEIAG